MLEVAKNVFQFNISASIVSNLVQSWPCLKKKKKHGVETNCDIETNIFFKDIYSTSFAVRCTTFPKFKITETKYHTKFCIYM